MRKTRKNAEQCRKLRTAIYPPPCIKSGRGGGTKVAEPRRKSKGRGSIYKTNVERYKLMLRPKNELETTLNKFDHIFALQTTIALPEVDVQGPEKAGGH